MTGLIESKRPWNLHLTRSKDLGSFQWIDIAIIQYLRITHVQCLFCNCFLCSNQNGLWRTLTLRFCYVVCEPTPLPVYYDVADSQNHLRHRLVRTDFKVYSNVILNIGILGKKNEQQHWLFLRYSQVSGLSIPVSPNIVITSSHPLMLGGICASLST